MDVRRDPKRTPQILAGRQLDSPADLVGRDNRSITGQNPDGTGGTVTCSLGSLPPGTSVMVRIDVSVTASGSITNTASVAGAEVDPAPADNEATTTSVPDVLTPCGPERFGA